MAVVSRGSISALQHTMVLINEFGTQWCRWRSCYTPEIFTHPLLPFTPATSDAPHQKTFLFSCFLGSRLQPDGEVEVANSLNKALGYSILFVFTQVFTQTRQSYVEDVQIQKGTPKHDTRTTSLAARFLLTRCQAGRDVEPVSSPRTCCTPRGEPGGRLRCGGLAPTLAPWRKQHTSPSSTLQQWTHLSKPICIPQHMEAASRSQCSKLVSECNSFVLLTSTIVSKKLLVCKMAPCLPFVTI